MQPSVPSGSAREGNTRPVVTVSMLENADTAAACCVQPTTCKGLRPKANRYALDRERAAGYPNRLLGGCVILVAPCTTTSAVHISPLHPLPLLSFDVKYDIYNDTTAVYIPT